VAVTQDMLRDGLDLRQRIAADAVRVVEIG
jgi:hypothetical protein